MKYVITTVALLFVALPVKAEDAKPFTFIFKCSSDILNLGFSEEATLIKYLSARKLSCDEDGRVAFDFGTENKTMSKLKNIFHDVTKDLKK